VAVKNHLPQLLFIPYFYEQLFIEKNILKDLPIIVFEKETKKQFQI